MLDKTAKPTSRLEGQDLWLEGVIIGFEANRGVILLKHRSFSTVQDAFAQYCQAPLGKRWVAWFSWNCIYEKHRDKLMSSRRFVLPTVHSGKRGKKKGASKKPTRVRQTLAQILIGRIVHCRVEKSPTWKAHDVLIQFGEERLNVIGDARWHPNQSPQNDEPGPTCIHGRLNHLPTRNNARKPWGGMS